LEKEEEWVGGGLEENERGRKRRKIKKENSKTFWFNLITPWCDLGKKTLFLLQGTYNESL
jgi:hypothetical protein